jgi:hypothetical protein
MKEFFELIHPEIDDQHLLSIWTFPNKASQQFASHDEAVQYVETVKQAMDVYYGVSLVRGLVRGRGGIDDAVAISCVWADIDVQGDIHQSPHLPESKQAAIEFTQSLTLAPTLIVDSGNGVHGYWVLEKPIRFHTAGERYAATELTKGWHAYVCQEAVKRSWRLENLGDLARVLRPPGALNHKNKSNIREAVIVHRSGEVHSIDAIRRIAAPAFALMGERPRKPTASGKPRPHNSSPDSNQPDALKRCIRYLDQVPGAIEGQQGGTQTLLACRAIARFGLEGDQARIAFDYYNQKCEPEWTNEKQIEHKLSEGRKLADRDGEFGKWLESSPEYNGQQFAEVDMSKILAALASAGNKPTNGVAQRFSQPFPQDCLRPPGLLEQIIDYNLRTSLFPQPELALAGALALMGTITGRKVQDSQKARTNVYILGLAPSGSGKERARAVNKELLLRAGEKGDRMIGPEGIASSAGLISFVATRHTVLFQLDEIARILQTMRDPRRSPHLHKIGTELMKLESNSHQLFIGDAYADQKKTAVINQPHACVYGTSTPEAFWESLTADNVTEGLLGRIMVFEAGADYVDFQAAENLEPPDELLDGIHFWMNVPYGPGNFGEENPSPMVLPYSQQAKQRIDSHFSQICQRRKDEESVESALWSRTIGKTSKLALLFACSRCTGQPDMVIELEDVNRAIKISNWLTRRMLRQVDRHVSENEREGQVKKVLRLLEKPMTKTSLTKKTQSFGQRLRNEIIADLLDADQIATWFVDTGGTRRTQWLHKKED